MRFLFLLFLFSNIVCFGQSKTNSTYLYLENFPSFKQNDDALCWAASLQMIYNFAGTTKSQCDFGNLLGFNCQNCSSSDCCNCKPFNSPISNINSFYKALSISGSPTLTNNLTKIKKQIDTNNKPFVIDIGYKNYQTTGHYIVGKGIHYLDTIVNDVMTKINFIIVNDPFTKKNYYTKRIILLRLREDTGNFIIETEKHSSFIESLYSATPTPAKKVSGKSLYDGTKTIKHRLSEIELNTLCKQKDYFCDPIIFYYIKSLLPIRGSKFLTYLKKSSTKVFDIKMLNSKLSTRYQQNDNIYEPMVVFESDIVFKDEKKQFYIYVGGKPKIFEYLPSTKGKGQILVDGQFLSSNTAQILPYPYEFVNFNFQGIDYFYKNFPNNNIFTENKDIFTKNELINIFKK